MNWNTYRITFTEYHNECEDTDKRIVIQHQTAEDRDYPLSIVDVDYEIKKKLLDELKTKLGVGKRNMRRNMRVRE